MPTLQCTRCGATHHTAATGPHLALAPLMFGCQACGSREPLRIGAISNSSDRDEVAGVARGEAESMQMRTDA
jgi:predicted  nucleic acid-binding Zn-ribbon protein